MKYYNKFIFSYSLGFLLLLSGCFSSGYQTQSVDANYMLIDSLVDENMAMENVIKPYRDSLNVEMQTVIGVAAKELSGGLPEGLLSNFVTDLIIEECHLVDDKPDICIINIKGLRVPINKGEIKVENIYQLMPFENEVVYLTMSKDQIIELFDFMASVGGDGMSGASFGIKNGKAVDIKVGGGALEDRNYIVATSDYLADGGDHFKVFQSALAKRGTGIKVRDAIIEHVKRLSEKQQKVDSQLDKRIYYAEE